MTRSSYFAVCSMLTLLVTGSQCGWDQLLLQACPQCRREPAESPHCSASTARTLADLSLLRRPSQQRGSHAAEFKPPVSLHVTVQAVFPHLYRGGEVFGCPGAARENSDSSSGKHDRCFSCHSWGERWTLTVAQQRDFYRRSRAVIATRLTHTFLDNHVTAVCWNRTLWAYTAL